MNDLLLGIDIGGTKTSVSVGSPDGHIRQRRRIPTLSSSDVQPYFRALEDLCRAVLADAGVAPSSLTAIGISAPGPLSVPRGLLLAPPNNPGWADVPIVEAVGAMFPAVPLAFNNDANAAALAEYFFGSHAGCPDLVYLTHSTGIGAGIIAAGRLVQGACDMGGEVGHHTLDVHGPPCPCGRRGCFEVYVGGRNVALRLQHRIRTEFPDSAILRHAGGAIDKVTFEAFVAAVKDGDALATEEWDQYLERLAQGIGNIIMMLNPSVILMGTIAIHTGDFLLVPLRKRLENYAWSWPLEACSVLPSGLGPAIGDLAALALARQAMDGGRGEHDRESPGDTGESS